MRAGRLQWQTDKFVKNLVPFDKLLFLHSFFDDKI